MSEVISRPGSPTRDGVRIRTGRTGRTDHARRERWSDSPTGRSAQTGVAVKERASTVEERGPTPSRTRTSRPIALVTGGAQGLGAAIAEELAAAGHGVVVADIQADRARERAQLLDPVGDDVAWVPIDVADRRSVDAAMDVTLARFGRLDVLVNNAGIDQTAPFDEIDPEVFDQVVGVNLLGPVNMTRAALPALRRSDRGMVINIVSTAAKRTWPNASAYHASKWGLLGFSHALHAEARTYGVRVTAVICGGMRTPFILERFPEVDPATLQDPRTVARTIRGLVTAEDDSVVPELTILPMRETSWP
jgi:NAD(P)-dependent dehydrogenase (short-subunit alcohol dehydrogenase family)